MIKGRSHPLVVWANSQSSSEHRGAYPLLWAEFKGNDLLLLSAREAS
jgi:hypothetical protein